jgi:hypothetical protein
MTERAAIKWVKDNLGPVIRQALATWDGVIYTEDWLGGIAFREVSSLLYRYVPTGITFENIALLMKGDYGQRKDDKLPMYHGYSFFQIDIASYPEFVKSGEWKDPLLSANKAISVLEGKRKYLQSKFKLLGGESLDRAITAAYNTGEGNVKNSIIAGKDVDSTTTGHDYSKAVFGYRSIYRNI